MKLSNYLQFFILGIALILISCSSGKVNTQDGVYTRIDEEYKKTRKTALGQLDQNDYEKLIEELERVMDTTIPKGRGILINFNQRAPYCYSYAYDESTIETITDNSIQISANICVKNAAVDYFIYTSNSYFKSIYEKKKEYKLDPGYFADKVFSLKENCSGFLALRADGQFMKYYGDDYFTKAAQFLSGTYSLRFNE